MPLPTSQARQEVTRGIGLPDSCPSLNPPLSRYDYSGGVFTSSSCGGALNHAVVVVGAGYDADLKAPYWCASCPVCDASLPAMDGWCWACACSGRLFTMHPNSSLQDDNTCCTVCRLIRNSWGAGWGEGGYMRLLRGVNMCNVERYAYQVKSADKGSGPKPEPPPEPGCSDKVVSVNARTSLVDLAVRYKTTVAAIQLDNGLDGSVPLQNGQRLLISCPSGTWSDVYGVWNVYDGEPWAAIPARGYPCTWWKGSMTQACASGGASFAVLHLG